MRMRMRMRARERVQIRTRLPVEHGGARRGTAGLFRVSRPDLFSLGPQLELPGLLLESHSRSRRSAGDARPVRMRGDPHGQLLQSAAQHRGLGRVFLMRKLSVREIPGALSLHEIFGEDIGRSHTKIASHVRIEVQHTYG